MTRILVVDPESSGLDLVSELRRRNVDVTIWHQERPFVLTSRTDTSSPSVDLVKFVDDHEFDSIIAGGESGVSASEWLAARRGLPTSDSALIYQRRDKNAMIEAIANQGVPASQSFHVDRVEIVRQLANSLDLPVMVKPANSAGSDMCRTAATWQEAEAITQEILEGTSILGYQNTGAVVQEFLNGDQFHVNTVVIDGKHEVTEVYSNIFRDRDGAPHLYKGRSYRRTDPYVASIVDYALAVNLALGASAGATHTEIRLTDSGPRLIEFNGRLMGPCQPTDYFVSAQGYSQASIYADVLSGNPAGAKRALTARRDPEHVGFYLLTAFESGTLTSFDDRAVTQVQSYRGIYKAPHLGQKIDLENRTTDAELGVVFFANTDPAKLEADLLQMEYLERNGQIHRVS